MLTWLAASCWLLLTVLTCFKARRKTYLPRLPLQRTFFKFGIGWIQLETESLNDLPTKFWETLGVLHQYPTNSRPFRNPKTFDDDSEPSQVRPPRRPSAFSQLKRLIFIAVYDIGAVLSVLGVFVALVVVFHVLFCLIGKMCNLMLSITESEGSRPLSDSGTPAHDMLTAAKQLVKRATLPTHESQGATSYPHPAGIPANNSFRLKQNTNAMLLELAASDPFTLMLQKRRHDDLLLIALFTFLTNQSCRLKPRRFPG
ncbi:hypothetical protein PGTUg99_012913 [Puccinia graminis f. sp. tritici]|uniref:Uncharacterized protein n=1 Tax=Puccinia graminis f. sp. tritici TaxID=56615 RepID=A0A5B0SBA0_PUCGR|nr:hypothetical protein PGTUg99_012913 [Puccinia graminis f. sp. tritici]